MLMTSVLSSFRAIECAVLSTTSHARLSKAEEPRDFDTILKRMIREVKFYGEALLTIVLYIDNDTRLESMALACLLFTIIVYMFLEALSGPALHKHLTNSPHALPLLALLSKAPALSVLMTLISLALTQWEQSFTTGVLTIIGSLAGVGVAGHAQVHVKIWEVLKKAWEVVGWVAKMRDAVDEVGKEVTAEETAEEKGEEGKTRVGEENV